jgi:hypothetical protein
VADLETEIRQRLAAHAQDEGFLRHSEAVAALRAVLDLHPTSDVDGLIVNGRPARECKSCGLLLGEQRCRTVLAVARELGVETT